MKPRPDPERPGTEPRGRRAPEAYAAVALGRATVSALRSSSDLWHGDGMKISRTLVVLDAADLEAMSTFWSAVLGGTVDKDDDWHMISVDGEDRMGIQLAPDHVPPQWPDGSPQQIHLDLFVEDIAAAHDEVMALGAKLLKAADDLAPGEGFQVYADPAGHPFCLCWD